MHFIKEITVVLIIVSLFPVVFHIVGKIENNDISYEKKEDDVDSDDSGGMFNDPNFKKTVTERTKSASEGGITVAVSKPIEQGEEVKIMVVIENQKIGTRMYFIKAPHVSELMKMRTKTRKNPFLRENNICFEDTFKGIIQRDSPSSTTSKYLRVGNNSKTVELISFTVTLPHKGTVTSNIDSVVKSIMDDYFKYVFARERKVNTAGELALTYAKQLLPDTATPGSGLYGHLLTKYGDGNFDTASQNMTAEINKYWSRDITYVYDCHLDKYMVNYDIKKWVEQHMGATSWDDLSDGIKKICFKSYPGRDLPEWSGIVQESYL